MVNHMFGNRLLGVVGVAVVLAGGAGVFAGAPTVIKATPDDGDDGVDPNLREIRIEFDQDMRTRGFSVCGGGPKFPNIIGNPRWASKRVCVML
jgi:hypothetical protein